MHYIIAISVLVFILGPLVISNAFFGNGDPGLIDRYNRGKLLFIRNRLLKKWFFVPLSIIYPSSKYNKRHSEILVKELQYNLYNFKRTFLGSRYAVYILNINGRLHLDNRRAIKIDIFKRISYNNKKGKL